MSEPYTKKFPLCLCCGSEYPDGLVGPPLCFDCEVVWGKVMGPALGIQVPAPLPNSVRLVKVEEES